MALIVAVPAESHAGERRVALDPAGAQTLMSVGAAVRVQGGAGRAAGFDDQAYRDRDVEIVGPDELFSDADVILQVRGYGANPGAAGELQRFGAGHVLVACLDPLWRPDRAAELARTGVTAFALELIPRITRAQRMDVLSSMATVAGYEAAILAARHLDKMFPMLMTAAGSIAPAKVLVVGAGVAGLQAIATCRRLGAVVTGYDIRPAAKEQVLSLGARFLELELDAENAEAAGGYARAMDEDFYRRQRELLGKAVAESDVGITTAAVPGKKSPVLITADMVAGMRSGSVVVDLAAERGGNCERTRPDETVDADGVTILGPTNLASAAPRHASRMFANNIVAFLTNMIDEGGQLNIDMDDPIVAETLVTRGGKVVCQTVIDAQNERQSEE